MAAPLCSQARFTNEIKMQNSLEQVGKEVAMSACVLNKGLYAATIYAEYYVHVLCHVQE